MTAQPRFQPGDRALACSNEGTDSRIKVGTVYYVFGVTNSMPQHIRISNDGQHSVWPADLFDRMRPAHLLK